MVRRRPRELSYPLRDNERMRAVLVDTPDVLVDRPEALLEHRRLLGLDKKDECWDGEWHLVNPPKLWHSQLNSDLFLTLGPIARAVGLRPYVDCTGVFGAENNWRVPDQVYARDEAAFEDGLRSAELLVESAPHVTRATGSSRSTRRGPSPRC